MNIEVLTLMSYLIIYVYHIVCSLVIIASVCFFENFLLRDISDSDIIESSPLLIMPVEDKSIIVSTVSVSIMNAYCMKMIGVITQMGVSLFKSANLIAPPNVACSQFI